VNFFSDLSAAATYDHFYRFGDLSSLIRFIRTQKEAILYPVGKIGQLFLDVLMYSGEIKNFCCVAIKETGSGRNVEQRFTHFLPIIPFEMLATFKETATFVVIAPLERHEELRQDMLEFGFKRMVFLDESIQQMIKDKAVELNDSNQVTGWFMDYVMNKLREMEYRIAEQNEVSAVNTKTFKNYAHCFLEKKIVILGKGATAMNYEPIPDAVHIGVNLVEPYKNISLDYLFSTDYTEETTKNFAAISSAVKKQIFLGWFLDRLPEHWRGFPESYFLAEKVSHFYLNSCAEFLDQPIYRDICHHGLADFGSAVFAALHFALYTQPEKIYLVGCDVGETNNFYTDSDEDSGSVRKALLS